MTPSLFLAAALAGGAYTLTPGPAFLALLGIGAGQGRGAGAGFMAGHLVGDILWAGLALVAIIGANLFGSLVFDLLGLACGGYLMWLGIGAVRTQRGSDGEITTKVRRPMVRGLLFGVTNPKGYPVAVAMFTALLAGYGGTLDWSMLPMILGAAVSGFLAADLILLAVIGAPHVRRFYKRHEVWIARASGVIFIGFALHAIANALPGLAGRRA